MVLLAATVLLAASAGVAGATDDAAGATAGCRAEIARRLHVEESRVGVGGVEEGSLAGQTVVTWSAPDGSRGGCVWRNGRVESWSVQQPGRRFDAEAECAGEVARRIRKRPRDVEIVEVDTRSRSEVTVYWTTYQGQSGVCVAGDGRIREVRPD